MAEEGGQRAEERRRRPGLLRGHLDAILTGLRYLSKRPMTLMYPDVEEELPSLYHTMILYDYDRCIGCSLCAQICPSRAIRMYRVPGDKRMRPGYNVGRCIHCGLCTDVCPTDALSFSPLHDDVFEDPGSMDWDPVDWALASKRIREEASKRRRPRVRAVVDEEVGLRYEPAGGNG
jgi:NADH-quinone oxidoreductase subunit I